MSEYLGFDEVSRGLERQLEHQNSGNPSYRARNEPSQLLGIAVAYLAMVANGEMTAKQLRERLSK